MDEKMTEVRRRSLRILLPILLFVSLVVSSVVLSAADSDSTFYAITNLGCNTCVEKLQPLVGLYGESLVQLDIREAENSGRYYNISDLVGPEVYKTEPLVVVFKDGNLVTVVFGFHPQGVWEETIMGAEHEGVPVYSNLYDFSGRLLPDVVLTDEGTIDMISDLFGENPSNGYGRKDFYSLLPLVATAALVDAINPCEFYVLAVFLSLIFFRVGRRAVLKAGLAYAFAVFVTYYLMGFGLWRLMDYAQHIRLFVVGVFGFVGLVIGFREVLGAIMERQPKRVPDVLSEKLSSQLDRVSENPLTAVAIGIVSAVFLLPCTSAPYFMAVVLIESLGSLVEGLVLLTVYNGIVIAPFIAITVCIHTLKLRTMQLKSWSSKHQRWLNLVSGLLIILLGVYLLSTIFF